MRHYSPCDFIKPKVSNQWNHYNSDPLINQSCALHVLWPVARIDLRIEFQSRSTAFHVFLTAMAHDKLGAITRVCISPVTSACT